MNGPKRKLPPSIKEKRPGINFVLRLDGKVVFRHGLLSVRSKLEERFYTSVSTFSADLARVFTSEIGVQPAGDTAELQMQISGRAPELSLEQREKRKLAKRIIKAIQPALEDAIKKESELSGKPFEKELKELDLILESSVLSRRASLAAAPAADVESLRHEMTDAAADTDAPPAGHDDGREPPTLDQSAPRETSVPATSPHDKPLDIDMPDASEADANAEVTVPMAVDEDAAGPPTLNGIVRRDHESVRSPPPSHLSSSGERGPLTPPLSFQDDQQLPLTPGGIPWYVQPFDPIGTTIHEERWTGRDVMRGMSEELSELDEDELEGLVDPEVDEKTEPPAPIAVPVRPNRPVKDKAVKAKVHKTRKRWRGFK